MNRNEWKLDRDVESRLQELLGSFCDETLNDAQQQELESLLLNQPEAQKYYHQYMLVHSELFWLNDTVKNPNTLFEASESNTRTGPFARWQGWVGLAAALLIGLGLGLSFVFRPAPAASEPSEMTRVATITGTLNCRWESDANLGFGSPLFAGQQLELTEGVAELTFQGGARLILQSPARLDVSSHQVSELHQGRLTASCPPGSEGFRVNTNGLVLIDRGNEFAVSTSNGKTEVHVFDGLVEGHYQDERSGQYRKVEWRTDETAHFDGRSNQVTIVDRPRETYVRSLGPGFATMNGVLAVEDFDYPVGPLGGQNGGLGWGGPWENIDVEEGNVESNRVAAGNVGDVRLPLRGNHAVIDGNFNRIRRVLSTSFKGVFDSAKMVESQDGARLIGKEGNTLYIGFSQKVDALDQVFYGVELNRGDGNRNRVLCIGHAAAKGWTEGDIRAPNKEAGVTGWAVTSEFNQLNGIFADYGSLGPETLDEVLIVIKLTFGPNHQDRFELFLNPQSMLDETQCKPVLTGEGNFAFDRIGLANFEGRKAYRVDHIRIGTSFPSVTQPMWTGQSQADRSSSS